MLSTMGQTILAALRRDGLVLLWYLGLGLFAMQPVLSQPRTLILGELGDNIHYVYMAGWAAQALPMGLSPLVDPRLNYPDDLPLSSNDWPYVSYLLVAPATLVLGPVFGYNLAILLSHVLSGYFTYLWALRLTGSKAGAIFAGTAFLLTPFRLLRSTGHANIVTTQMLPLFFWALDHAISTRAARERSLWVLALATALLAGSSQYLLIIGLVCGAIYTLVLLWPDVRAVLVPGWRIAVSVLLGALIGALPYLSVLGGGAFESYPLGRTRIWSADPLNFLLPSAMHPLWGAWIEQLRPEPYVGEKTLYVSLVALSLAVLAVWTRHQAPGGGQRIVTWVVTAGVGFVFALGTDLWLNNQPLSRDVPFWLPAYYLAQLPGLGLMRVWSRFGIITILFVALLAAFGVRALMVRLPKPQHTLALGSLLIVGLMIDLLPGTLPATRLAPREIDRWLAAQTDDFAVAFLPVDKPLLNDLAIFGSLYHAKQLPAYLHQAHQPRAYQDFASFALRFPDPQALAYLRWRGFRYLVLDTAAYNGWRAPPWPEIEAQLRTIPELYRVAEVDGFVVLSFMPVP